ncbi:DUF4279 domain-containing protein [Chryseobacterium balustinum]|uniref:DUF4279 domain-containing protein n=1 Tax=Chryseobacterium balustinum TaxID=246 RepID=A0AAX2IIY0_9FLAO|nr:DUF4279 domain-containing protein [Chryseobacterium balustinum]AZB30756.1 DUF4279 domain-containing protein [Chryseobacterium balustinum]SKC14874.1 protein of unknown function [Chryseobacterium balustinum]SQA88806.1 Uncharacterised protein [Chryseobacterium balustinum]
MTEQQVIELIQKEFKEKTLGVTKQYLEIHSPIYADNKLKIDRIDRDRTDNLIIAYLPVLDEKFYFAVYIDTKSNEVISIDTEAYHQVYFRATSETLSSDELKVMTRLTPTELWNKGDLRKSGKSNYTFSNLTILPNPEPDEFEDKLKKLLDFLEGDKEGIKQLVEKADGYVQVAMEIHKGNGMIGGHNIDTDNIRRMNDLGLSINFDLYVAGNSFKE